MNHTIVDTISGGRVYLIRCGKCGDEFTGLAMRKPDRHRCPHCGHTPEPRKPSEAGMPRRTAPRSEAVRQAVGLLRSGATIAEAAQAVGQTTQAVEKAYYRWVLPEVLGERIRDLEREVERAKGVAAAG